jgi:GxxExxY protein
MVCRKISHGPSAQISTDQDRLVEDCNVVELKAVKAVDEARWAQCLNYLKATGLRLCLLINFVRPRVEIKRIAL